ncbi:MAG: NDP-sugar synthase [Methanomassiliicoccales archaeon]|nr:NDP-sugar synthase [Methanomassiliicoccales archaeon]
MKALILAGGMGTRLRPLTLRTPKPLLPLVGKPLVMHIIDRLPQEVETVILAVSYMREALETYFRENDCGRQVVLVEEKVPLGTGGAIRNVRQHLDGTFLCFNGDIVSSLDPVELLQVHRHCQGIGTLALWKEADPSAFGVVEMKDGRISGFQEKPPPGQAVSHLVNAGIYAFEPRLLDHIGEGTVSLERDVFPRVLDEGLFGHRFSGHWVDCGTPESYLRAQATLIDGGMDLYRPLLNDGADVIGPNHLDGVSLVSCRVGPHVCALPGSRIMRGSVVERSVLMTGALVGEDCQVRDSILGPGAAVGNGTMVTREVLVGVTPVR